VAACQNQITQLHDKLTELAIDLDNKVETMAQQFNIKPIAAVDVV
jgi:hypothetical protein